MTVGWQQWAICAGLSAIMIGSLGPNATLAESVQSSPLQLTLSDRGETVASLQRLLQGLGYLPRSPATIADGVYGAQTRAAVIQFQAEQSQPVDGVVKANTWPLLAIAPWQRWRVQFEPPPLVGHQLALRNTDPEPEAPSPLWLIVMPAIPLLGGLLTYWKRRLM